MIDKQHDRLIWLYSMGLMDTFDCIVGKIFGQEDGRSIKKWLVKIRAHNSLLL